MTKWEKAKQKGEFRKNTQKWLRASEIVWQKIGQKGQTKVMHFEFESCSSSNFKTIFFLLFFVIKPTKTLRKRIDTVKDRGTQKHCLAIL